MTAEQAVRERAVGEDADPVRLCVGKDIGFDVASEHAVGRLQRFYREHRAEPGHLLDIEVGHAHVADLALGHKAGEDRGGVLEWGPGVGPVDLVEIYDLGAECPETCLEVVTDPCRARITRHTPLHRSDASFGRDEEVLTGAPLERSCKQPLRFTESVGVSGVKERDPLVHGLSDGSDGCHLIQWPPVTPELPGAESDPGHSQVAPAERRVLHVSPLLFPLPERRCS